MALTPEAALVAFARVAWQSGRRWSYFATLPTDAELLALVPAEARRVLLDPYAVREGKYPCGACGQPVPEDESDGYQEHMIREYQRGVAAGRAAGRREAFEECEQLVLDGERYGNYFYDGRRLIAEYIREAAGSDSARAAEPMQPVGEPAPREPLSGISN